MSPFEIRKVRFSEFCLLVKRLNEYTKEENTKPKSKDGKKLNLIPVTDYREEVAK